ncbi:MAG: ABC transporter ATP-binding protein [Caldilineaceae bacterium]
MPNRLFVYRRILHYLQPYRAQVITAYTAMLFAALLNLFVPQIIKNAIDRGLAQQRATALLSAAGLVLGLALLRGVASFAQRFYGQWLTYRFSYDIRNDFYHAVQTQSFAFHDRAHTGDLMSRATSDTSETEQFAGIGLMDLTSTVLLVIGVVIAMFLENAWLTLLALPAILLFSYLSVGLGTTVEPMFKAVQKQMGKLSTLMQESLTGISVVKAFAREPHEFAKFDEANETWLAMRRTVIRTWGNYWPSFTLVLMLGVVVMLWVGGPQAINGQITVGSLFAMISYLLMLNGPVQRLGFLVNLAATASASAGRIFEIIDTPRAIQESPNAIEIGKIQGRIHFEDVSFAYDSVILPSPLKNEIEGQGVRARAALDHVCFSVEPGQTVALIGPTGSGKSTIINLLPRFYDPSGGRVLVDGNDVRDLKLRSLRRQIGIVLQNPFLFSATIAENIAYGRTDATMDEIVAAAKAADVHDFVQNFPNGYQTRVGERGVTLSGGQKQRVAIARALLTDPAILILDDSTSSVDTETEHQIQQALAVLMKNRTTLVIAQRLLTLKNADCILVLDHGAIVERGTHEELLKQEGLYKQIYDLQLKDQEEFVASQQQVMESK